MAPGVLLSPPSINARCVPSLLEATAIQTLSPKVVTSVKVTPESEEISTFPFTFPTTNRVPSLFIARNKYEVTPTPARKVHVTPLSDEVINPPVPSVNVAASLLPSLLDAILIQLLFDAPDVVLETQVTPKSLEV
ncbi:unannotated protein [freshwater metagenome]|uniref:Unannotated protein n=1 Tax=freshwater metagenome TaxID=449393 RepID=A0A6J6Q4A8_9ZZZZ